MAISTKQYLPPELIREILSRLPNRSLCRFRYVSTSWLQLLTLDPSLFRNPSILAIDQPRLNFIFATDYNAWDKSTVQLNLPVRQLLFLGICNGLFCLSSDYKMEDVIIFNPLLQEYITLPSYPPQSRFIHHEKLYDCGFCFQNDTKEYKVIRLFSEADFSNSDYHSQISICARAKDSGWEWKTIHEDLPFTLAFTSCPFVDGAVHWLSLKSSDETDHLFIIALNVKDETYIEFEPPLDPIFKPSCVSYALTNLREKLCIYSSFPDTNVQIWIMGHYGVMDSWSKLFNIGTGEIFGPFNSLEPLGVISSGEIILKKDRELVLCNPQSYAVNNLGGYRFGSYLAFVYTPSIISPLHLHDGGIQRH